MCHSIPDVLLSIFKEENMVKKNNKKCILCGKTYTYCSRCEEFDHLPRWMEIYCSDNCRTIFNTLIEYNAKNITAKEAAEKILVALSDFMQYMCGGQLLSEAVPLQSGISVQGFLYDQHKGQL